MPAPDPGLLSVFKMALRNALKLVRGLRKEVGEIDEDVMARKLIEELGRSGYRLVRDAPGPGLHVFRSPEGPRDAAHMNIRHAMVRAQRALAAYLDPGEADKKDPAAVIKALLGILDDKVLLRALAATDDDAPPDPPGS